MRYAYASPMLRYGARLLGGMVKGKPNKPNKPKKSKPKPKPKKSMV